MQLKSEKEKKKKRSVLPNLSQSLLLHLGGAWVVAHLKPECLDSDPSSHFLAMGFGQVRWFLSIKDVCVGGLTMLVLTSCLPHYLVLKMK